MTLQFSASVLADINNGVLENYLDRGKVWEQNVSDKPMLKAFNQHAGKFSGGNEFVSFAVKAGQGGLELAGYSGDDQVSYGNPTGIKRVKFAWREHHIGMVLTHTELKVDGIDVSDEDKKSPMTDREKNALVDLFDEKMAMLGEDYAKSLDSLIHGDGTSDAKAIAGIASILTTTPSTGSTGGLSRAANSWWRHLAPSAVTSASAGGGALITHLDENLRVLNRYKKSGAKRMFFCGSDFIDAYKAELRANGSYSQTGWNEGNVDGSMPDPKHRGQTLIWDPTLDDLSKEKYCYAIDMNAVRLLYMDGQRMKKHNPARPYDRYVTYSGITMTGVLVAKQLNSSAVFRIA